MKHYLIIISFLFSFLPLSAIKFEGDFGGKKDNVFDVKVISYEVELGQTTVTLAVANSARGYRDFDFSQGASVYGIQYHDGLKIKGRSYSINGPSTTRHKITITFPTGTLVFEDELYFSFNGRGGRWYTLSGIKTPQLSVSDLEALLIPWEAYCAAASKHPVTFSSSEEVRQAIQQRVDQWQEKGEFETTAAWQERVNDATRTAYIAQVKSELETQHRREVAEAQAELGELRANYEAYKKKFLDTYYNVKMEAARKTFPKTNFELKPYDADHQTFLITNDRYGDILLPVPAAEAQEFKRNWEIISASVTADFVPDGDKVSISRVTFENGGKEYVYDSHTKASYAAVDIDYNFAPIEISDVNFADLNIGVSPTRAPSSDLVTVDNTASTIRQPEQPVQTVKLTASNRSDVDSNIPASKVAASSNTFAVIIANEDYRSVPRVPYAINDGEILSRYLTTTLGLPQDHVKTFKDATFGNIAAALRHIDNLSTAFGNDLNIIFYYSGHGIPDEKSRECLLIPVDGDPSIPETCVNVNNLYAKLSATGANSVLVLFDACFSGTVRGEGSLNAARGVKIKPSDSNLNGNIIVFSAAQGDETAYPYEQEQHGLFTYYVLKHLQEKGAEATVGSLADFVTENVKKQSVVSNGKLQTPSLKAAPQVSPDFRDWHLTH